MQLWRARFPRSPRMSTKPIHMTSSMKFIQGNNSIERMIIWMKTAVLVPTTRRASFYATHKWDIADLNQLKQSVLSKRSAQKNRYINTHDNDSVATWKITNTV